MNARLFLTTLLAGLLVPALARAADDLGALQKRFKERHAQIQKLKSDGIVGETYKGYVEFVDKKDPASEDLVKSENEDRKTLYDALAKKENTTAEKVAERNAKRNFERAKSGEYLQDSTGKWQKKSA
jgi:uncharacterized protein YdbL (DUF1318 family)